MIDGTILIDKPAGMTSFGVVARLRRVLTAQQKAKLAAEGQTGRVKVKVGHTGTLDPFATGLMIIVVGKECRNAQHYTKLDKEYEATITLGMSSSTGDPEGELTPAASSVQPTRAQIDRVIAAHTGKIQQRPPVFSAIKIDGQRAYKLARDGKEVELPLRTITVYELEVLSYDYPQLTIRTKVSSGTYIRSLAVDIGKALGTEAYCSALRRTEVGKWRVDEAKTLADFGITN